MITGLIVGLTIATKIIFLPIILLPLFVLSNRTLCITFTILGFIIGIVPIIGRFGDFQLFINKLFYHDGIYGSGQAQIINPSNFLTNIKGLFLTNKLLSITLLLSALILALHKGKGSKNASELRFLIAFISVASITTLMVAKHFKNYYMIGTLILLGPVLYVIYQMLQPGGYRIAILCVAAIFGMMTLNSQVKIINSRSQLSILRMKDREILKRHIENQDYLFIKPEWSWGPGEEYGLIFGLSYVRHRDRYTEDIRRNYYHTLSYEGAERNPLRMRVDKVPLEELVGHQIHIVNQPTRNSSPLIEYLEGHYEMLKRDTIPLATDNLLFSMKLGHLKDSK
ncbi:MAG: hypothetical protein KDC80_15610 [Saprospiraceae bacterium]|nr:hypothetical protein [Saprospiraceae bacterium]